MTRYQENLIKEFKALRELGVIISDANLNKAIKYVKANKAEIDDYEQSGCDISSAADLILCFC